VGGRRYHFKTVGGTGVCVVGGVREGEIVLANSWKKGGVLERMRKRGKSRKKKRVSSDPVRVAGGSILTSEGGSSANCRSR